MDSETRTLMELEGRLSTGRTGGEHLADAVQEEDGKGPEGRPLGTTAYRIGGGRAEGWGCAVPSDLEEKDRMLRGVGGGGADSAP